VNLATRAPTASLFVQLLVLIVLAVVGALTVNLLVVLNLPPPAPDFYRLAEIARILKEGPGVTSKDHRPLVTRLASAPPVDEGPMPARAMPAGRRTLAQMLGVDPANVVISSDLIPFNDRREFRIVRTELAQKGEPAEERFLIAPFQVGLKRADGRWLIVQPKPTLVPDPWQQRLIVSVILSALALTPIAYLFARRLAKPLARFAEAAEHLGRDPHSPPLAVEGPSEIAAAARAFNDMQRRLARYVEDRTAMVGAIAHDLRTPLTRLRFRAESAPEDLSGRMVADIAEMEAMVSGALAFVHGLAQTAERTPLELSSLIDSLADEMSETGLCVTVEGAERVVVEGDPVALKRLFNNLLHNAVKFGRQARVNVFVDGGAAIVEIDDDGCGLPASELERVFEPFHRHEASRSRETGGIGLGLTVARSVARAHGGDVDLANRAAGGLTARVTLPL
jgi:two-component system OmpR family sensor kinase